MKRMKVLLQKTVLETYIREDNKLIHLVINSEEIITTETHPLYVNDRGFVNAGELTLSDKLLDTHGSHLSIEKSNIELTKKLLLYTIFKLKIFILILLVVFAYLYIMQGMHINVRQVIVKALGIKHGKKQRRILLMKLFVILKQENQLTPMSLGIWGINLVMSLENIEQVHRNVV